MFKCTMAKLEGSFTEASGLQIAIVVARFNDLVTSKLLSSCLDCLQRHGIETSESSQQLDIAWVPGSFELPIVSQSLARSGRYQVIITLGAVIRGDTPHFDVVVAEASKGIAAVSRDTAVPITPVAHTIIRHGSDCKNKGFSCVTLKHSHVAIP